MATVSGNAVDRCERWGDLGAVVDAQQCVIRQPGRGDGPAATVVLTSQTKERLEQFRQQHTALGKPDHYQIYFVDPKSIALHNLDTPSDGAEDLLTMEAIEERIKAKSLQVESAQGRDIYITPVDVKYYYLVVADLRQEDLKRFIEDGYQASLVQQLANNKADVVIKVRRGSTEDEGLVIKSYQEQLNQQYGHQAYVAQGIRMAGFNTKGAERTDARPRVLDIYAGVCQTAMHQLMYMREEWQEQQAKAISEQRLMSILKPQGEGPVWKLFFCNAWARLFDIAKSLVRSGRTSSVDYNKIDSQAARACIKEGIKPRHDAKAIKECSPSLNSEQQNVDSYCDRVVQEAVRDFNSLNVIASKGAKTGKIETRGYGFR